jgi:hypothetical protein
VRRREFITLLGGAVVAPHLAAAHAQTERVRRVGALINLSADDPEGQARVAAFLQGCRKLAGPWAATCGSTSDGARATAQWGPGATHFRSNGQLQLEAKEHVKSRLNLSPDLGDAHALTFVVDMTALNRMSRDHYLPPRGGNGWNG